MIVNQNFINGCHDTSGFHTTLFNLSATDYSFPRKGLQIYSTITFLISSQRLPTTGAEEGDRMSNRLAALLTITQVATLRRLKGEPGSTLRAELLP
jgi:hypothetical protein